MAQLSTDNTFPRWCWASFHFIPGRSRTCYLQGVQPARFLARLCLLAAQGDQEVPSPPEKKEVVKGFVRYWENVPKCNQVLQQNITLMHPDLICPERNGVRMRQGGEMAQVLSHHAKKTVPLLDTSPRPPLWALTQCQRVPHHINERGHSLYKYFNLL